LNINYISQRHIQNKVSLNILVKFKMQISIIFSNINSPKISVLADRDWYVNCRCLTFNMAATELVESTLERRYVIRLLWPHGVETGECTTEL
jgi:hypothetical protein